MTAAKYFPELFKRRAELQAILKDLRRPKGTREQALRELRAVEKELDLDKSATKGYNK
jgi:hypothetical protein